MIFTEFEGKFYRMLSCDEALQEGDMHCLLESETDQVYYLNPLMHKSSIGQKVGDFSCDRYFWREIDANQIQNINGEESPNGRTNR